MPIYAIGDREPTIDPTAYVHPDAVVIGDVQIGPESSIWPGAVLRGDYGTIIIGSQTSIQDGSVIHCTDEHNTVIGNRVTVGHNVHIEGALIHDDCLIGSGSTVLNESVIGPHSLVGAGALVGLRKVVPPHARALGVPCVIQESKVDDHPDVDGVSGYVENARRYAQELRRLN
ncbi:MAG: gamma carbonic anhydrase family protein [Candidatus Nanopelagicales bacterium]|nr:gamma carbonic anhydrase family protein [Candidatus Nanopelagicales bacterium]